MAYTVDEATILKVKNYLLEYKKKYQRTAQMSETASALKLEYKVVQMCYQELADRGLFKRNYSQYKFEPEAQEEKPKNVVEQVKAQFKKLQVNFDKFFIDVLRIVMLCVGIGAIYMSTIFTYDWGIHFFKVSSDAFILSLIMIVFSVVAFQVFQIFKQNGQYGFSAVFFICWVVVLLFSMQSTVAYLYNTRMAKEMQVVSSNVSIDKESLLWDDLITRESEQKSSIESLKERLSVFDGLLKGVDPDEDKKMYEDYNKKISETEGKIKESEKELKIIRDSKNDFLSNEQQVGVITKVKKGDFYVWAADILNVDSDMLEFVVSCFPAVFVDVVAPLSISVSLFLRRREKKESRLVAFIKKIFSRRKEV
jgi:hypothetical protein